MSPLQHIRPRHLARRGNSIVLVSALLVMLVIIAAAYVTRTNAGRVTARAVQAAEARDANAELVAEMLASIPADALFVQPLDPTIYGAAPTQPADSNAPRLPARMMGPLFDVQPYRLNFDVNYPYNHVPNHDIPFTNWPDEATMINTYSALGVLPASWPAGPGNPSGSNALSFAHEGNPIGNPGYADNRWMRDFEPVRIDSRNVSDLDAFSHWRHLTYLGTPTNQWRVCRDISDITNLFGTGGVVDDLTIPIEQWLADPNDRVDSFFNNLAPSTTISGNTRYIPSAADATDFGRWLRWTGVDPGTGAYIGLRGYQDLLTGFNGLGDGSFAPGNFFRLRDLNADFLVHNYLLSGVHQDRPESEFVFGTARNEVSRFLADSDGDGYTDAFWHLVPLPVKDGVRMVAAVSIIPNNAMLNVNVATRFQNTDDTTLLGNLATGPASRTRGHTPADLALVGSAVDVSNFANWNVGFYDDPLNDFNQVFPPGIIPGFQTFDYDTNRWFRHVEDIGMFSFSGLAAGVMNQVDRLDYWRRSGIDPLAASSVSFYRPFALADDLELRMFAGNNYEWTFTNYEHSVQDQGLGFMRAGPSGPTESNELGSQVSNRVLVRDARHRVTMYNAVRNELLPHWLQYRWARDVNSDGIFDINDIATLPLPIQEDIINNPTLFDEIVDAFFEQQRYKLDLREPVVDPFGNDIDPGLGRLTLRERLPIAIAHALDDGPRIVNNQLVGNTYHGSYAIDLSGGTGVDLLDTEYGKTRAMAASFTANMMEYRDADSDLLLADDPTTPMVEGPVPLSAVTGDTDDDEVQYLGMEPQPFLVEVFIGHIYKALTVPNTDFQGHPYFNAGSNVILHNDDRQSTVVVVQIANPYDEPIDLGRFKLSVFGQTFDMVTMAPADRILEPAYPERPTTAIFYAIDDDIEGDAVRVKWLDFLDLEATNHPSNTIIQRVTSWSTERDDYDIAAGTEEPVVLLRSIENPPNSGIFEDVVIDRIERGEDPDNSANSSTGFADAVEALASNRPPDQLNDPPDQFDVPPFGAPYQDSPEWDISPNFNHWVQWVRITRAWGVDVDYDGVYQHDERAPRYIIGDATYHTAKASVDPDPDWPVDNRFFHSGNGYDFSADPDDDGSYGGTPSRPVPWFWRDHYTMGATVPTARKPTFFDMNDGVNTFYPDKGWYSQGRAGVRRDSVDKSTLNPSGDLDIAQRYPLQMLQKNGDFEQIGEVMNVWLWGHELEMSCGVNCSYVQTRSTFSELFARAMHELPQNATYRARSNRLTAGRIAIGADAGAANIYTDPLAAVPNQPAGFRVLDLFVCDGYGANPPGDLNGNSVDNEPVDFELARFANANGFSGRAVHGLLNINVAPPEVLRALPHWSRLVWENGNWSRSMLPEATVQYRERYDADIAAKPYVYRNQLDTNLDGLYENFASPQPGPDYSNRDSVLPGVNSMRDDRGFATIGELMMLNVPAGGGDPVDNDKWRIDYAGLNPFARTSALFRRSVQLSTDIVDDQRYLDTGEPANKGWDEVAGDAEERNLLFAGASNMITTRTDTFTIYFRLRSFKQNPVTGRWDATDPEYIVDDSRYVMLVDRSNVNKPGDKPKILYFEKLPN